MEEPQHLGRDLALYTVSRLALAGAVTVLLLVFDVPLLVSIAIAIVVGFPLALVAFPKLNRRVTAGLAARGAAKHAARERLRAELRGEDQDL